MGCGAWLGSPGLAAWLGSPDAACLRSRLREFGSLCSSRAGNASRETPTHLYRSRYCIVPVGRGAQNASEWTKSSASRIRLLDFLAVASFLHHFVNELRSYVFSYGIPVLAGMLLSPAVGSCAAADQHHDTSPRASQPPLMSSMLPLQPRQSVLTRVCHRPLQGAVKTRKNSCRTAPLARH